MHAAPTIVTLTRPQLRQRLARLADLRNRAARDAQRMGEAGDHHGERAAAVIVAKLNAMAAKVQAMLNE